MTIARVDHANLDWEEENAARDPFVPLERSPPRATHPQTQEENAVAEQGWDDWDRWVKAHVQNGTDVLATAIGEEVGKIQRDLEARIAKLEEEVGQLKADRAVARAAQVIDLPDWRHRDVA
jgi:hypothetical protein